MKRRKTVSVTTAIGASTVAGEFTRRVRLAVGSFRTLGQFLRIRLDAATAFAFISHKLLRWVLPFLMLVVEHWRLAPVLWAGEYAQYILAAKANPADAPRPSGPAPGAAA